MAAHTVVTTYKPIVFQPIDPAFPTVIMSTTERMTFTKTRGKTMHLRERICVVVEVMLLVEMIDVR